MYCIVYFNADHGHTHHPPTSTVQQFKKSHVAGGKASTAASLASGGSHASTSHMGSTLKSMAAPPVKQRNPASNSATEGRNGGGSGNTLKAKVPPPVPPRGSPRKRGDSDAYQHQQLLQQEGGGGGGGGGSSRALSTTPGIESKTKLKKHRTKEKTPLSSHNDHNDDDKDRNNTNTTLQVPNPEIPLPRFGEKRSPSNVRDWLELHDLFDGIGGNPVPIVGKPPPIPPQPQIEAIQKLRRKDSVRSITSSTYSAARSRISHTRPLNHVDMFHRQNNLMAGRRPSVAASIVYSFPPIPSEVSERSISLASNREERASRSLKKREKRMQYMQYADMALADENNEPFEDNLLQSMHAFIEVKQELEKSHKKRYRKTNLPLDTEMEGEAEAQDDQISRSSVYNDDDDDGGGSEVVGRSHNKYYPHTRWVKTTERRPSPEPKPKKKKNRTKTRKNDDTTKTPYMTDGFPSSTSLNPPILSSRRSSFVEF